MRSISHMEAKQTNCLEKLHGKINLSISQSNNIVLHVMQQESAALFEKLPLLDNIFIFQPPLLYVEAVRGA